MTEISRARAPDRRARRCRRAAEARALAEKLGDAVRFYKIGLELFTTDGYFELLDWLARARQQGVRRPQALRHPGDRAPRGRQPARQRRDLPHRARPPLGDGGGGEREGRDEDPRGDGAHQLRPARPRRDGATQAAWRSWCCSARARRVEIGLRRRHRLGPGGAEAQGGVRQAPAGRHPGHPARGQRDAATRSAPWTWRRPSPTAPTTSWSAGRSATRPTRAPPPRRSRPPSPPPSRPECCSRARRHRRPARSRLAAAREPPRHALAGRGRRAGAAVLALAAAVPEAALCEGRVPAG